MKKRMKPGLLLIAELVLTVCVCGTFILTGITNVRTEANHFAADIASDYSDLESRYISVFKAITIQVREEMDKNPGLNGMNAWLQSREESFRDAVGDSVYDGFAMTYQGGYAHSWNYGDYSDYDPNTRVWYQAAQRADGAVTVVAPYVTYVGGQFPNSDQYIELSVAQKYSEDVSFELDLKIYDIKEMVSDRNFSYSGAQALLFDANGYILGATDGSLYCHNVNVPDETVSEKLSSQLLELKGQPNTLKILRIGGRLTAACALLDASGNTYVVMIPFQSVFARDFLPFAVILLLLILLEVGIYINNRRTIGEMQSRDRIITAIARSAFQRQVYVDLATMTARPDEQSRGMMPRDMDYREAFARLSGDIQEAASRREFEAFLGPDKLAGAEDKGLQSRRFTFDIPRREGGVSRRTMALSLFVTRMNGKATAIIMGNDVTDEEREQQLTLQSIAHHYKTVIASTTSEWEVAAIKSDGVYETLYAQGLNESELHRRYAESVLKEEYVDEYVDALSHETIVRRLAVSEGYSITAETKDGHWLTYRIIRGEGYAENHRFIYFAENADEQMRNQAKLKEALRKANAAAVAKNDFLSRMSHDIRTPMNGIIGMTHLAREERDPAKIDEYLDKIDTSSRFLLGLVNDVLDMSKVENGKIDLHPEPYPAEEFFAYLDSVIRPQCDAKKLRLALDADVLPDKVPLLDKLRSNQIALNLLSNAVKFTPEGGTVKVGLHERLMPSGKVAMEAVIADTGAGMSREFQKVMFEPFSQERRNDVADNRGTGLGLAIVSRMVTLMGGTIGVQSEPGKGTTFTLRGEVDCVPADELRKKSEEPADYTALRGVRVLLCEDHPLNQEIARALLKEQGMTCDTAENGKLGAERFEASAPGYYGAVLMDIRMPVMSGYEAARRIRALKRPDAVTVPIIAMTADAFEDDVRKCLDAGMDGHVAKPIEPELLYGALLKALRRDSAPAENGKDR